MKRVESLDYLRGLLALSVMVYHFTLWSAGPVGSESALGRLGIYAVSTFYILSGLSLGMVYRDRMGSLSDAGRFAIKRVFRIAPLFWIVVTLGILAKPIAPPAHEILLNYTLLFGFIEPTAYFSIGAWSIGNEMVFYAMFPLIMVSRIGWWLAGSIAVAALFAFWRLDPGATLAQQWPAYINPLNQMFLFVAGVAIARGTLCAWWSVAGLWVLLAAAVATFVLWPMTGDSIAQVTGTGRVVMSAACVVFVLALYRLNPTIRGWAGESLAFLGRGSYSIYLLHPLVATALVPRGSGLAAYLLAAAVTLGVSWVSFRYVEAPMMALGSGVAKRRAKEAVG